MLKLLVTLLLVAFASGNHISRVVNGEDADPDKWRCQVSLQYLYRGAYYHTCGGTLICPDWVMTAAHCYDKSLTYRVVLGDYDLSKDEGTEQVIPVADFIVHEDFDYNHAEYGNDIALIKLSWSAEINDKVKPCKLPKCEIILPHGTVCYVTGWGYITNRGPLADILQQGEVPVVDYEHCSQSDWWGSYVKETMICAGGDDVGACSGDSGGPLFCLNDYGCWEVHGIVSFGSSLGCDYPKKPTVYTRVSAFIDWIKKTKAAYEGGSRAGWREPFQQQK